MGGEDDIAYVDPLAPDPGSASAPRVYTAHEMLNARRAARGLPPLDPPVPAAAAHPKVRAQLMRNVDPVTGETDLSAPNELEAVEARLLTIFADAGLPRLGGASGERGWSSISRAQRCMYLWKRSYIDGERHSTHDTEIGSLFHTYAAVLYQKMIDPAYPLTPRGIHDLLLASNCSALAVLRAWEIWEGYTCRYAADYFRPLAVELRVEDPTTGDSARYDLLASVEDAHRSNLVPGTYIVEHKTAGRFDDVTLHGWGHDGEIQGQILLYDRAGLTEKYGPLRGVVVNVVGKQKKQQFHRTAVAPSGDLTRLHIEELRYWTQRIEQAKRDDEWPRSKANCYGRGKCSQWDHCLQAAPRGAAEMI